MESLGARLLEIGFNDHAVAVMGVTQETLRSVASGGAIPWRAPGIGMLDYQARLVEGGRYLYYVLPFVDRIVPYNRFLASAIKDKFPEGTVGLQTDHILGFAQNYADSLEIRDFFFKETGIYANDQDILKTAKLLDPDKFNLRLEHPQLEFLYEFAEDSGKSLFGKYPGIKDRPKILEVLVACMDKRGALLFLNGAIFNHEVRQGVEADNELLIVTSAPLYADVVCGAQLLTI